MIDVLYKIYCITELTFEKLKQYFDSTFDRVCCILYKIIEQLYSRKYTVLYTIYCIKALTLENLRFQMYYTKYFEQYIKCTIQSTLYSTYDVVCFKFSRDLCIVHLIYKVLCILYLIQCAVYYIKSLSRCTIQNILYCIKYSLLYRALLQKRPMI